jgi:hypothetical protein
MFRTGAHRGSACYLYRDGEVVPAADLGAVLVQGDAQFEKAPRSRRGQT